MTVPVGVWGLRVQYRYRVWCWLAQRARRHGRALLGREPTAAEVAWAMRVVLARYQAHRAAEGTA
jgi:hypothetical protein